jgi:predicted O-methyltransferase YrrM
MNTRPHKNTLSFIAHLTGAQTETIAGYFEEINSNHQFHSQLNENRNKVSRRSSWGWGWGVGLDLGQVLYAICRHKKPQMVVETGVASGESSSYFLEALENNQSGRLYSIDPGWPAAGQTERLPGWVIPDYLRNRWQLLQGSSDRELEPLLKKLGQIDIFLHDSDHSYRNMIWEYRTAWSHLNPAGLLLSHNIDVNDAFPDFCRDSAVKGFELANLGGILKP